MSTTLIAISSIDLVTVAGGQAAPSSFADFTNSERNRVAGAYRQVVCTAAGIKGGPDLASGVYGAGATDADKIRAAATLNKYCTDGVGLPAQAPKSAF